ncbi:hypothetical protein LIER_10541 [Lithospermum erythrorhizon]|uniref:Uncharacterized protein n=1 Tax=Lithospermum erythrorhizon TaxID=34254 RepID=A0AAV3PJP6_LITER
MDLEEHEEPRLKKVKYNIADTDQANGLDEVMKNISPSNQTKAFGPGMNNSSVSVDAKSDFDIGKSGGLWIGLASDVAHKLLIVDPHLILLEITTEIVKRWYLACLYDHPHLEHRLHT